MSKKLTVTLSLLFCFVTVTKYAAATSTHLQIPPHSVTSEEDSILKYIAAHHLTAFKTASGLYYVVENQGAGEKPVAGQSVTVNYTGALLNGFIFDSSTDPKFEHVEPINFILGQGMVIKGWEEGILLFNVGGKGKLLIPSSLAYGEAGAGETIAPYSPLLFDVEVLKVEQGKKYKKPRNNKSKKDDC